MDLNTLRASYPQYDDIPDGDLVDRLHQRFYADLPRSVIEERLGLGSRPGMDVAAPMPPDPQPSPMGDNYAALPWLMPGTTPGSSVAPRYAAPPAPLDEAPGDMLDQLDLVEPPPSPMAPGPAVGGTVTSGVIPNFDQRIGNAGWMGGGVAGLPFVLGQDVPTSAMPFPMPQQERPAGLRGIIPPPPDSAPAVTGRQSVMPSLTQELDLDTDRRGVGEAGGLPFALGQDMPTNAWALPPMPEAAPDEVPSWMRAVAPVLGSAALINRQVIEPTRDLAPDLSGITEFGAGLRDRMYQAAPSAEDVAGSPAMAPVLGSALYGAQRVRDEVDDSQFAKGIVGGLVGTNVSTGGAAIEGLGHILGNEGMVETGRRISSSGDEGAKSWQPRVRSYRDVGGLSDAMAYLGYSAGQGTSSMAPGLAVGTAVGALTANPIVGFVAGASMPSFVQNYGDVYSGIKDDKVIRQKIAGGDLTERDAALAAAAAAIPMAALDTISLGSQAGAALRAAQGELRTQVVRRVVLELAKGTGIEGITEGLQEVISQATQALLGDGDWFRRERIDSVIDNAIGGAATGGLVRGGGMAAGAMMQPEQPRGLSGLSVGPDEARIEPPPLASPFAAPEPAAPVPPAPSLPVGPQGAQPLGPTPTAPIPPPAVPPVPPPPAQPVAALPQGAIPADVLLGPVEPPAAPPVQAPQVQLAPPEPVAPAPPPPATPVPPAPLPPSVEARESADQARMAPRAPEVAAIPPTTIIQAAAEPGPAPAPPAPAEPAGAPQEAAPVPPPVAPAEAPEAPPARPGGREQPVSPEPTRTMATPQGEAPVVFPDELHTRLYDFAMRDDAGSGAYREEMERLYMAFREWAGRDPQRGEPFSKPRHVVDLARDYVDQIREAASASWGRDAQGRIEAPDMVDADRQADYWRQAAMRSRPSGAQQTPPPVPATAPGASVLSMSSAPPGARIIRSDTAVTPAGTDVPVRYAVVELDTLVPSQTDDGAPNPQFTGAQPRDRTRAASQAQVAEIAAHLDPRRLDVNPSTADGAPLVGPDGMVDSGNGRVLALRRAYDRAMPSARVYRDHLARQGYPVEGMQRPVLVRINDAPAAERARIADESNARSTLAMSATEQAMADAKGIGSLLQLWRGGEITAAPNRDFVRRFVDQVMPAAERGGAVDSHGNLSAPGIRRIQAAMLAAAYGDANLVETLIESADSDIKAIGGALVDAAPAWAQMRAEAEAGRIDPVAAGATPDLLEAVRLVQRARSEGQHIADLAAQMDMFGGRTIGPKGEAFLRLFFRDTQFRSPRGRPKIAEALNYYATEARKTQPGPGLLGDESKATPGAILENARRKIDGPHQQQGDLLAPRRAGAGNRGEGLPPAGGDAGQRAAVQPADGAGDRGAAARQQRTGEPGRDALPEEAGRGPVRPGAADRVDPTERFQTPRDEPPAPPFYSALSRGIADVKITRGPREQWSGIVANLAQKGVKRAEIEWSGVEQWLRDRPLGQITKQDVLDYLRSQEVRVREVVKDDETPASERQTKYRDYTLPGGQNYRELLLTLPNRRTERASREVDDAREARDHGRLADAYDQLTAAHDTEVGNTYRSSHFDEPNILAHVRFDERTDAAGNRVLFIEEIQSDWHQAGRRNGYRSPGSAAAGVAIRVSRRGDGWSASDPAGRWLGDLPASAGATEAQALSAAQDRFGAAANQDAGLYDRRVPDAPFKTTWQETAFRRMVRWAAENGFDRIAWTTGEQQADRFDLSKRVKSIAYQKNADGTYKVDVATGQRDEMLGEAIAEAKLEDYVGKDVARRIIDGVGEERDQSLTPGRPDMWKTLSGLDLKVGGEGMRGFYDKMLVDYANKWGRRFGARVEPATIGASVRANEDAPFEVYDTRTGRVLDTFVTEGGASRDAARRGDGAAYRRQETPVATVHSLAITPQMRDSVMREGVPLWQRDGGRATARRPVDPAALAAELRRIAPLAKLELVDRLVSGNNASYLDGLIRVALSGKDPMNALRHEVIHALRDLNLIRPEEWALLKRRAEREWIAHYKIAEDPYYRTLSHEAQVEEAIAEAFAEHGTSPLPAGFRSIWENVKRFFERLGAWLRGQGFQTVEDVFGRVESGEVGARIAKAPRERAQSGGIRYQGSGPTAFVVGPSGSIDLGQVAPEVTDASGGRVASLPIRMQEGTPDDFGRAHIEADKLERIQDAGYASVTDFVIDVAANHAEVWQEPGGRLLLVKPRDKYHDTATVELRPDPSGSFYGVTTAFPVRQNKKYPQAGGRKLLWRQGPTPLPAASAETAPFAPPPETKADPTATGGTGQSSAGDIAPAPPDGNPGEKYQVPRVRGTPRQETAIDKAIEPVDIAADGDALADLLAERNTAEASAAASPADRLIGVATGHLPPLRTGDSAAAAPLPRTPDLNFLAKLATHPRTVALNPRFKGFAPVYATAVKMFETRDRAVSELARIVEPYSRLSEEEKRHVNAVLEIGRLKGEVYAGRTIGATNTVRTTDLSRFNDSIVLTPAEREGYLAVRATMDRALDLFRDHLLVEWGFDRPGGPTTAADFRALVDEENRSPSENGQLARYAQVLTEIEDARRTGYVPFSRFGQIGLTVRDQLGGMVHFEKIDTDRFVGATVGRRLHREAVAERRRELLRQYPAADGFRVSEPIELRGPLALSNAGVQLSDVDALAELGGADPAGYELVRKALEDGIKKAGFRSHLFSAKQTAGYSPDFERSIADYITGLAGYLARRQADGPMQDAIGALAAAGKQPRLTHYARRYQEYVMSPINEWQTARQLTFLYYLTSPATGMVNMSQVPLFSAPYLSGLTNPAQVGVEITRAYKDAAAMLSVAKLNPERGVEAFDPDKAPADVRDALRAAFDDGYLVPQQTYEQMAKATGSSPRIRGLSKNARTAMDALAALYTITERTNRIVTFIATLRLARSDPRMLQKLDAQMEGAPLYALEVGIATPEKAARWITDETQFKVGKVNRPEAMRGPGAWLLQFKGFVLHALELQYRQLRQYHGAGAKTALALNIAGLLVMAGIFGFPGADDLKDLAEGIYKFFSKRDIDIEREVREFMHGITGSSWLAEATARGIGRQTGVDFAKRVGMGDILPGASDGALTWSVVGDMTIGRTMRLIQHLQRGDHLNAVAELLPALIANPVKALGMLESGVRSLKTGRVVLPPEKVGAGDIAARALGFTSTDIARRREAEYATSRAQRSTAELRTEWYTQLARALAAKVRAERVKDADASIAAARRFQETIEEIRRHNASAPPQDRFKPDRENLKKLFRQEIEGADGRKVPRKMQGERERIRELYGVGQP